MYCPKCGTNNRDGVNYCMKCGFCFNSQKQQNSPTQFASNSQDLSPKYILKGLNGQLYVYDNKIEIKRKGALALGFQGLKGTKSIPISAIKSIQVKPSGFTVGYIQFGIAGGTENRRGVKAANYDENTITFSAVQHNKTANNIKNYLESVMFNRPNSQSTIVKQALSGADELKKIKELLDEGVITQEEFDAKKKQLLGL